MNGRIKRWLGPLEATAAILCFGGGIIAGIVGSVLTAVTWIVGAEQHPWVRGLGTALLVATIPLLIAAGYCLDWMERDSDSTARKRERGSVPVVQAFVGTIVFSLIVLLPLELRAQQTIFNVPTTDILEKGKVYVEVDVPFKLNNDPGSIVPRFSSFVPRVVVGAGSQFEVGLNITGNINPGKDSTALVPAIKFKAYDGGKNGWAIVLGDNLFIPVRNKSYNFGNYVYAEASKTFRTKTRVTFGGYHFSDSVVAAGAQRGGAQFGFEQPITPTFGFAADWYTGKHAAGYFTPGVIFKPHPRVTGYAGYSLGNSNLRNGNHFFLVELGYNFN